MLKKRTILNTTAFFLTAALFTQLTGQNANQLAQKMDLENGIKDRISTAIERVLGHDTFVVNVTAEVDFMPDRKIEEVYKPSSRQRRVSSQPGSQAGGTAASAGAAKTPSSAASGTRVLREILPGIPSEIPAEGIEILEDPALNAALPGTEDSLAGSSAADAEDMTADQSMDELAVLPGMQSPEYDLQDESEDLLFSRSVSHVQSNVPRIRHLDISIFLPEGISPDLLESVRQVARIASQFDRDRGDIINIMTTAFKPTAGSAELKPVVDSREVRYEMSREEKEQADETRRLILDIQRQLDDMDRDRNISPVSTEPSATENMLMKVIDKLTVRAGYEDEMEAQRIIADQNARIKMLAKDTSELTRLNNEIAALKAQLAQQAGGEGKAESQAKLEEKRLLEAAIAEKISMLNTSQEELAGLRTTKTPLWVWILLPLLGIALAVLGFMSFRQRSTAEAAPVSAAAAPAAPAIDENEIKKKILADIQRDLSEQNLIMKQSSGQSSSANVDELSDIRNNIVNLSVANPDTASVLMKKWVNDAGEPEGGEKSEEDEKK